MSDDKSVVEALEESVAVNSEVVHLLRVLVEVQKECLKELKRLKK